jgi:hypothetical protein
MAATNDERTVSQLFGDTLSELAKLIQNEVDLAGAELKEKLGLVGGAIGFIAAGPILLIPSLVLLLFALASWFIILGVAACQMRDGAIRTSQNASDFISDVIQQNPLLVGGIGLAVGALIASALPRTDAESGIMGDASADIEKRANDMAARGFEAAKD